jgi:hypothetical protein
VRLLRGAGKALDIVMPKNVPVAETTLSGEGVVVIPLALTGIAVVACAEGCKMRRLIAELSRKRAE